LAKKAMGALLQILLRVLPQTRPQNNDAETSETEVEVDTVVACGFCSTISVEHENAHHEEKRTAEHEHSDLG
jgi:hypothetical protein